MRCIIAGGREIDDPAILDAALAACPFTDCITSVVCGKARGVDTLGERWARAQGFPVDAHPADWTRFGKSAGPRRNEEMADVADALLAIPGAGNGTRHMIAVARKRGLLVYVYERIAA